jgi:hypothetical protein
MTQRSDKWKGNCLLRAFQAALLLAGILGSAGLIWRWTIAGPPTSPLELPATVADLRPVAVIVERGDEGLFYRVHCTTTADDLTVGVRWQGPNGSVEGQWSGVACADDRDLGAGAAAPLMSLEPGELAAITLTVTRSGDDCRQRAAVRRAYLLGNDGRLRSLARAIPDPQDPRRERIQPVPTPPIPTNCQHPCQETGS